MVQGQSGGGEPGAADRKTETYNGKKSTTYTIRWAAAGRAFRDSLGTKALANSFRVELTTAARKGEVFDTESDVMVLEDPGTVRLVLKVRGGASRVDTPTVHAGRP
ncbi:MAG: hypothetical protein ACRDQA_15930 [Nocardioidaceae bacterium]